MSKQEKIFAVLIAIGIAFRLLHWDGADIIYIVGLAGLSFLYWPLGFAHLNGIRARKIFSGATYLQHRTGALVMGGILGLSLATALIGTLFASMFWVGAWTIWPLGLLMLFGSLIAVFLMRQNDAPPGYTRGWLIRGVIVLILALVLPFSFTTHKHPLPSPAAVR